MSRAPWDLVFVPIRCPECTSLSESAEVLAVADGPGVCYTPVASSDAKPGDVRGRCPTCGKLWCVRIVRVA